MSRNSGAEPDAGHHRELLGRDRTTSVVAAEEEPPWLRSAASFQRRTAQERQRAGTDGGGFVERGTDTILYSAWFTKRSVGHGGSVFKNWKGV